MDKSNLIIKIFLENYSIINKKLQVIDLKKIFDLKI